MEILPFIKNLLIDSLAGISFRNLPFIIVQLLTAPITVLLGSRLLRLKEQNGKLALWGVAFTALFIIASTSVPLSILAGFITLSFIIKNDSLTNDQKGLLLIFSFSAGSGHLIILFISLLIILLFSLFQKKKIND